MGAKLDFHAQKDVLDQLTVVFYPGAERFQVVEAQKAEEVDV